MANATDGIFSRIPELEEYCVKRRAKGLSYADIAKDATELYRVPVSGDQVGNRLKRIGKDAVPGSAWEQRKKEVDAIIASLPQEKRDLLRASLTGMIPVVAADLKAKEEEDEQWLIPDKHRAPKRYPAVRPDGKPYVVIEVSDIHVPDHNEAMVTAFTKMIEEQKPDQLVLNGDIFNGSALCGYAKTCRKEKRSLDIGQEIETAKPFLQRWINAAGTAVYVGGNHDVDRMERLLANEAAGLAYDVNKIWYLMMEHHGYTGLKFFDPELLGNGRLLWIGIGDDAKGFQHGSVYPRHTAWKNLTEQWPGRNTTQGHTHRPQIFWHRKKVSSVGGHMLDERKMLYMPNPDWTPGFLVHTFYDEGTRVDTQFVRMYDDGAFLFAGTVYTA